MKVTLLQASDLAIAVEAARICYGSFGDNLGEKDKKLLHTIIKSGHESVVEHIFYTFEIENISRVCSHQLVRHRIASYSQKSLRYTEPTDFVYPKVGSIPNQIIYDTYNRLLETYNALVNELGVPKEEARYILPQGTQTSLVMTINARSLRNFLNLRLGKKAHWEIRTLAENMFMELPDKHIEWLFFDILDKFKES